MKKSNKLLLELERILHELHETINNDEIDIYKIRGYATYIENISKAILVKEQMKLPIHRRRT